MTDRANYSIVREAHQDTFWWTGSYWGVASGDAQRYISRKTAERVAETLDRPTQVVEWLVKKPSEIKRESIWTEIYSDDDQECHSCGAVGKPRHLIHFDHLCQHHVNLCPQCFRRLSRLLSLDQERE